MAAAHGSLMACPRATNNVLLTMGLLGRAASSFMTNSNPNAKSNALCTISRSFSSIPCGYKRKLKPSGGLSPWRRSSPMDPMSLLNMKFFNLGGRRGAESRAGMDSAVEVVAEKKPSQAVIVPPTFQQAIQRLQDYWPSVGCAVTQSSNTEVGAGTMNPATFLRVLRPEPWNVAYVEPSVRQAPDHAPAWLGIISNVALMHICAHTCNVEGS